MRPTNIRRPLSPTRFHTPTPAMLSAYCTNRARFGQHLATNPPGIFIFPQPGRGKTLILAHIANLSFCFVSLPERPFSFIAPLSRLLP